MRHLSLGLLLATLALAPTLAIWQEPQLALRTIWKSRAPADYNAVVSVERIAAAT